MILRHYRLMLESRPEKIAVREMRKHIGWYVKGMKGAALLRSEINHCPDAREALSLIRRYFEQQTAQEEEA